MKALVYIALITALLLSSCSSDLFVGAEHDDLYFRPSDQQVIVADTKDAEPAREQEEQLYYDEVYNVDTLIADFYYDNHEKRYTAEDNVGQGDPFIYYDDFSYASRISRFHGNYFYPYWRDRWYSPYRITPFYMGFGYRYPGFSSYHMFGYHDHFMMYDPFYYHHYGFHTPWLWGHYPMYGHGFYSSHYYYGYGVGYGGFYQTPRASARSTLPVQRRQTYSTVSSRYIADQSSRGAATSVAGTAIRRSGDMTTTTVAGSRRTATEDAAGRAVYQAQVDRGEVSASDAGRRVAASSATNVSRPLYSTADRAYTPTYSSSRVATRPSYNTSRANASTVVQAGRTGSTSSNVSVSNIRTQTSVATSTVRTGTTSGSSSSIINIPSRVSTGSSVSPPTINRRTTGSSTGSTGNVRTTTTSTGSGGRSGSTGTSVSTGRSTTTTTTTTTGRTGRTGGGGR